MMIAQLKLSYLLVLLLIESKVVVTVTQANQQTSFELDQESETWFAKYGPQEDLSFSGPLSYSHLRQTRCLENASELFDIAILGMPFDTAVSYRPGARFGPYAIRSGSRRQRAIRGYTMSWGMNPYTQGQAIIDCGDVPVTPFDNALAMDQMKVAYTTLLRRGVANDTLTGFSLPNTLALDGRLHPRIITLGGDHTIVLPVLRSLHSVYGPITVIHFDAHLDTWNAVGYPGIVGDAGEVNHGTFFWKAGTEGLLGNNNVHAGVRCKMSSIGDIEHDISVGFQLFSTDDVDDIGIPEMVRRIRDRVGKSPVYLSVDIDVLDPGIAPATGTPEAAGLTMRELKRLLRGFTGLNIVGADVVEVAPSYDNAEITGIAAADIVHDMLSLMTSSNFKQENSVHDGRKLTKEDL